MPPVLTDKQRDLMLQEILRNQKRILFLLDDGSEEPKKQPVKKDPKKLYGG